ncbi:MAG: hypothetical protein KBA30_03670 [Clostridia bacterium]|nr:hypothetical protein [Clostridia bacterium]
MIKNELKDTAADAIGVIKDMSARTAEGKALKSAYLSLFESEKDLLDQNIKWVKNGNASDKQEAMEMSQKIAAAQKAYTDALAALQNAITEAKATK